MDRLSQLTLQRHYTRVLATRKLAATVVLVGGLLLAPAAAWAVPMALPALQEEAPAATNAPQVIAQGIARLPKGQIGWTLQRVDVTGDSATPVAAFPLGFILSDNASVVVLTEQDEALGVLEFGEAIFLDGGPGGIAPWRDDAASLYELALVPQEAAGSTTANVIGDFFTAPEGRGGFEIELARGVLGNGMESTAPASRSGTPTLLLQTSGAAELVSEGGEPVTITAGQFALLSGAITVRGAGNEPSTFVVASIGEPAPIKGGDETAADAGANKANRAPRANAGGGSSGGNTGGGGGGGGGRGNQQSAPAADSGGFSAPSDGASADSEDKKAARAARQAERAAQQAAGTPSPVAESDETAADAGTPTPVEPEVTTPEDDSTDTDMETDTDTADEIIVDQDFNNNNNDDDDTPNVIEITEPTPTPTPIPPADQAPPTEDTTPPDGTTPGETPAEEVPAEAPVEQVPADEAPPVEGTGTEDAAPSADPAAESVAPVEEAPVVEEVPAEVAPVEEIPVEQVPADAPAADPAADPAAEG